MNLGVVQNTSRLGSALSLLTERGFKAVAHRGGIRSFDGALHTKKQTVRVKLVVRDWDFLEYPTIQVLDHEGVLPSLSPHVYADGSLCYFASGSIILDRYDPANSLAQCLDQAQDVLERILRDPQHRNEDVANEFLQYWAHGIAHIVLHAKLGTVDAGQTRSNYWLVGSSEQVHVVISDHETEVAGFAKALGLEPPRETDCPCWLLVTNRPPSIPKAIPSNLSQLFTWLSDWDVGLYKQLQRVLKREKDYLKYKHAMFAIRCPIGWLGFGFDLDPIHRQGAKDKPSLYLQWLHKHALKTSLKRLAITEFGPDYVHSRNLTFQDLKGKRITLVGCGAIGSHVATGLVRLGAGTGSGEFTLVDPDTMKPENLGRHILGYSSLFKHKATALAEELLRHFPFANVTPYVSDVRAVTSIFHSDLVIDATGEEALSELLNGVRLQTDANAPILHVRIRGNGECVQTFWAQGRDSGCFRCLLHSDRKHYRHERYPVLKDRTVRKHLGCGGFTPYSVSAPMHASALCIEVIVDWLRTGDASPRFRTIAVATANTYEVKNRNVQRLATCPACGDTSA
jgi:molybdopterin/thiamine biosynthesis adenylyltransferase